MNNRRISLGQIEVPEPCPADWNAMRGDRQSRFCEGCQKHVYNLSAMPREDAERLVCEAAGSLCVRFARAASGAVITLGYGTDNRKPRWRQWTLLGICGAAVAAFASMLLGRGRAPFGTPMVQGGIGCWPPATMPATMPTTAPTASAGVNGDANDSAADQDPPEPD